MNDETLFIVEMGKRLVGKRIRIDDMPGEPDYTGKTGTVEFIDSLGQLHGSWGGLAVVPESDRFTVLED